MGESFIRYECSCDAMSAITDMLPLESVGEKAAGLLVQAVRPLALRIAELFMLIITAIYVAKTIALSVGMYTGVGFREVSLVSYLADMVLMFISIDTVVTMSSRNPDAWKKTVRAAVLLVAVNTLYFVGLPSSTAASVIAFNPIAVFPISVLVIVLMMLPMVREYYVPIGMKVPNVSTWIAFAAFWPLFPKGTYRLSFNVNDDT